MKHLRPLWYTKRLQCEQKKKHLYRSVIFHITGTKLHILFFFSYRQSNGMLYSTRSHSQY